MQLIEPVEFFQSAPFLMFTAIGARVIFYRGSNRNFSLKHERLSTEFVCKAVGNLRTGGASV